jgi:hypothetical protein
MSASQQLNELITSLLAGHDAHCQQGKIVHGRPIVMHLLLADKIIGALDATVKSGLTGPVISTKVNLDKAALTRLSAALDVVAKAVKAMPAPSKVCFIIVQPAIIVLLVAWAARLITSADRQWRAGGHSTHSHTAIAATLSDKNPLNCFGCSSSEATPAVVTSPSLLACCNEHILFNRVRTWK